MIRYVRQIAKVRFALSLILGVALIALNTATPVPAQESTCSALEWLPVGQG